MDDSQRRVSRPPDYQAESPETYYFTNRINANFAYSDYASQLYSPPLASLYGVPASPGLPSCLNPASTEQLTPEQLAELDEYLDQLNRQNSNTSSNDSVGYANAQSFAQPLEGVSVPYGSQFGNLPPSTTIQQETFEQAATTGRDLYQTALNQWCSYSPSTLPSSPVASGAYNPFETTFFRYNVSRDPHANVEETVNQQETPSPPRNSTCISETVKKPSFAEVTKNKPALDKRSLFQRQDSNQSHPSTQSIRNHDKVTGQSEGSALNRANKRPKSGRRSGGGQRRSESKNSTSCDKYNHCRNTYTNKAPAGQSNTEEGLKQAGQLRRKAQHRRNSVSSMSSTLSAEDNPVMGTATTPLQTKGPRTMSGENEHNCESTNKNERSSAEKKSSSAKSKNSGSQEPYFDPRRIFANTPRKPQTTSAPEALGRNDNFVPNNKQRLQSDKDGVDSVKASVKTGSTKFINNDLRDSKKHTNLEPSQPSQNCQAPSADHQTQSKKSARSVGSQNAHKSESNACPPPPVSKKRTGNSSKQNIGQGPGPSFSNGVESNSWSEGVSFNESPNTQSADSAWDSQVASRIIGEWVIRFWIYTKWLLKETASVTLSLAKLLLTVFLHVLAVICHYAATLTMKAWAFIRQKIPYFQRESDQFDWSKTPGAASLFRQRQIGLKEPIRLPNTGEEAMTRLLSCKGKDPYSILGLRSDATDEDIKRYYRKQAFLVHPDKNKEPGAEESFKILGHAFDLIGTTEKRKEYDSQCDKEETEAAMKEFADLLSKLNNKMQEAANLLRCDHCGGKHKRIPTDRPVYCARFCAKCNLRHSVKEGDVWAESSVIGFLWHYYACMEGRVFDITEWAKCKRENFAQLQANAHHVIYRLATSGNRSRHANRSGEADLENFLNNLFHQTTTNGQTTSSESPNPPAGNRTGNHPTSSGPKTGHAARKKKKKH